MPAPQCDNRDNIALKIRFEIIYIYIYISTYEWSEGNLWKQNISFQHVGFTYRAQATRLGSQCPYPLRSITNSVNLYIYVSVYVCICVHIYIHICMHIYVYMCVYLCICLSSSYIVTYTCVYAHAHAWASTHTHTHTHTTYLNIVLYVLYYKQDLLWWQMKARPTYEYKHKHLEGSLAACPFRKAIVLRSSLRTLDSQPWALVGVFRARCWAAFVSGPKIQSDMLSSTHVILLPLSYQWAHIVWQDGIVFCWAHD